MASQRGIRAGKAFVELYANDSKLVRGLRNAQRRLKRFGASVTSMGAKLARTASIAAVPFALALRVGAQFSDQMSKVKAVTSGTADEFDKLTEKAKELGRTTSFTASQVAEGMVELGRAGFNRKEIDVAIESMLALARATDTELAEATGIAGAALRQFGLDATNMSSVADVLTATANGSAQTLTDLGDALKMVGPIASETSDSIIDTSSAIAILANNGIKGTMAGTALARAYKNLSSSKTKEVMDGIKVSVADANGNMIHMADILNKIGKATKNMGSKQRLNIFEQLFGRGQAASLKLAKAGAGFSDMKDIIENSGGTAKKTAKEMDNNLGGAFRKFMSMLEGVGIAIKDAIEEPVVKAIKIIIGLGGAITKWAGQNKGVIKTIVAVISVVGIVGIALVAFGVTISIVATAMGGLIALLSFVLSPIGLFTVALALLAERLVRSGVAMEWLGSTFGPMFDKFSESFESIKNALKNGDLAGAARVAFAELNLVWAVGVNDLLTKWNGMLMKMILGWNDIVGEISAGILIATGNSDAVEQSDAITAEFAKKIKERGLISEKDARDKLDAAKKEFEKVKTNDKKSTKNNSLDDLTSKLTNAAEKLSSVSGFASQPGTFSSFSELIFPDRNSMTDGEKAIVNAVNGVKVAIVEEGAMG